MQQTIQHLTRNEVRKFRLYLKFSQRNELLGLFNLFYVNSNPLTEKQIEERIYDSSIGGRRVAMLKLRLKETLFDFLIRDRMLKEHPLLEKKFIARVRIKKRLAQYIFLNNSGRDLPFAHKLLSEVIADAKKYECYPDLVYALEQQKLHFGFKYGEAAYEKWENEIRYYDCCAAVTKRAINHYYKLMLFTKFNGNPNRKRVLEIVAKGLSELKQDYVLTKLPVVLYYRQKLETEYYFQFKQFEKAKEVCLDTLHLLKKHPSLNDSQRTGYAHDYLAQCYVVLGKYKAGMRHFVLAQKYILKGTVDYLVSKEMEFLSLFYDRQFPKAIQSIESLLRGLPANTEPFRKGKLNFYLACTQFQLKRYSPALKALKYKTEVFNDKAGFMLSSKLIEIMILYEIKNFKELKFTYDRLRKYIIYNKRLLSKRDVAVLTLLHLLVGCNFLISGKTKTKIKEMISRLKSDRSPYEWQLFSHEVIRFESWVQAKFL